MRHTLPEGPALTACALARVGKRQLAAPSGRAGEGGGQGTADQEEGHWHGPGGCGTWSEGYQQAVAQG